MIQTEQKRPETAGRQLLEPSEFFQVGKAQDDLKIYLRYDLFRALDDFAAKDSSREQAGLLVGRLGDSKEGPFLVVEDAIEISIGDANTGRFSAASWQRGYRIAKTRHPQHEIVGWFHSHLDQGVELTEEELSIHQRHFPEEWQLIYVVDPVRRDRNFHVRTGDQMTAVEGFRIFGKEGRMGAVANAEVRSVKADGALKERYVERSLEKIQKQLSRPGFAPKDLLIIALLVTNLLLLLWRPTPPVKVDTKELEQGQVEISEQVGSMQSRLQKLERQLTEVSILDGEMNLDDEELDLPKPKAKPGKAQPVSGKKVRLHKVAGGDTLSSICAKYYDNSTPKATAALARHNKLKAPYYDIFPGDTLKIPDKSSLGL